MKVVLRNPRREVEVRGNRRVREILNELEIIPETVLVIRGDTLVTGDQLVGDADVIELRPVMSGGSDRQAREEARSAADEIRSHAASFSGHPRSEPGWRHPLQ
jgi:sulfur carrier protein